MESARSGKSGEISPRKKARVLCRSRSARSTAPHAAWPEDRVREKVREDFISSALLVPREEVEPAQVHPTRGLSLRTRAAHIPRCVDAMCFARDDTRSPPREARMMMMVSRSLARRLPALHPDSRRQGHRARDLARRARRDLPRPDARPGCCDSRGAGRPRRRIRRGGLALTPP